MDESDGSIKEMGENKEHDGLIWIKWDRIWTRMDWI